MALTLLPRKTLDMTKWPKIRSIVIHYVKKNFSNSQFYLKFVDLTDTKKSKKFKFYVVKSISSSYHIWMDKYRSTPSLCFPLWGCWFDVGQPDWGCYSGEQLHPYPEPKIWKTWKHSITVEAVTEIKNFAYLWSERFRGNL